MDSLGDKLKKIRSDSGRTQAQMASLAGVSVRYYQSVENDEKQPRFAVLYKMVRGFEINANYLFDTLDLWPSSNILLAALAALQHENEQLSVRNRALEKIISDKAQNPSGQELKDLRVRYDQLAAEFARLAKRYQYELHDGKKKNHSDRPKKK